MNDWETVEKALPSVKKDWDDEQVKEDWDDDDDVQDSWDAEPVAKPATTKKPAASTTTTTKKAAPKEFKEMTEEEKKAAQEAADLAHTHELFGLEKSLDEISLATKDSCKDYAARLYARLNLQNKSPHYVEFLEELFKTLSESLPTDSVKKLSNTLKAVHDAKLAEEKAAKLKAAPPKSKGKGKVILERDTIKGDFDFYLKGNRAAVADGDDGDDFM